MVQTSDDDMELYKKAYEKLCFACGEVIEKASDLCCDEFVSGKEVCPIQNPICCGKLVEDSCSDQIAAHFLNCARWC